MELIELTAIALPILDNLSSPEDGACARPPEIPAVMSVPEAAVHEEHNTMLRKDKIWPPGQASIVQPIPKAQAMQPSPDRPLGPSVNASNPGHHPGPRGGVDDIGHASGSEEFSLDSSRLDKLPTGHDVGSHRLSDCGYYGHNHGVTELLVCLRIGYRDPESVREPHQAGAFAGCKPARTFSIAPTHQDLTPIFVVPGRQGTGDAIA